ncbi:hypothetical protein ONE63_010672 [Megalurothrips usitatus]|uniref:Uncharacterized protein n=1 Tax=Megalurothrips usitatus TaxID=439358 RepID=A0AAV7XDQ7_9NEOP|nr:hypothetical protein ONE63_010672 [Megalurothrips usitatus]
MARPSALVLLVVVALAVQLACAFPSPQVNVNYPGGFVSVPQGGQGGVQVAYPGGFVNVPSRLSTFLNGGRPSGGLVTFPGGSVNYGR